MRASPSPTMPALSLSTSLALSLVVSLTLAGCAATPGPQGHAPVLPAHWQSGPAVASAEVSDLQQWWQTFGSSELDALIAQAMTQSQDVAAAQARVRAAQANAVIAGASLLPEVNATVSGGRQGRLGGDAAVDGTAWSAQLSASYEVDLWGRNRALRDSALSSLRASRFDLDATRLIVTSGVAIAWLQAVALTERADVAQQSLASAEQLLNLVTARARAGAATALEVAQQRGLAASQRRAVATLRQQAGEARTALAVLLGVPGTMPVTTMSVDSLRQPSIDAGLPSALLLRRPDIATAESRLAAAQADVSAARAAMFPALSLTAGLGYGGSQLRSLFDNPIYSVAAALAAPIFNAGRLGAVRDRADARREELLATYRQTIVAAAGDVERALNALAGNAAQRVAQDEELAQARRALTLAESRYRAGAESMLTLLDTQRSLYAAQDTAVALRADGLSASIALYKALGGGWQETQGVTF